MIFKIYDCHNDFTGYYFDNIHVKLATNLKALKKVKAQPSKKKVFTYSDQPTAIKIMLGTKCNYRCRYCRQNKHAARIDHDRNSVKIAPLLDKVFRTLDLSQLEKIEYWGGEPLLYWSEIKEIHQHVCKFIMTKQRIREYPTDMPLPLMHLTTNGSRLTLPIFNYLLKNKLNHGFIYKLSHDGPGQYLRGRATQKDPLKDPQLLGRHKFLCEQAHRGLKGSKFYINSVLTKENFTPIKIYDWFVRNFAENIQIRKMEPVIPYNTQAAEWAVQDNQLRDLEIAIKWSIVNGQLHQCVSEYGEQYDAFVARLADTTYCWEGWRNKCTELHTTMPTIDLDGNILPCQVFTAADIRINKNMFTCEDFSRIKLEYPYPPDSRTHWNCAACPVVSLCNGVCSYVPETEFSIRNCNIRKATYLGQLKAFLYLHGLDVWEFKPVKE